MSPGAESNASKRRSVLSSQWVKRKMSLSGVPFATRENLGVEANHIARWPSQNISNTMQKLGDAKAEDSVVRILREVLAQCENRISTVSTKGEDAIRMCGDFVDERDRRNTQTRWFNFCNAVWSGIHNYMNGQIQLTGSNVSQGILWKLKKRFERFRHAIGTQLNSLNDVQGEIGSGAKNMAQSVEYKLTETKKEIISKSKF